jgi:hypothetical protein
VEDEGGGGADDVDEGSVAEVEEVDTGGDGIGVEDAAFDSGGLEVELLHY